MTTRELLYIKTIADEKSMTRAAQKLFVTQPSLSHCVMTLEQQLGTRLFTRTAGGLVLTYAGEKYYRMACEVLRVYAAFESEINEERALSQGRVTVGITNYLATAHLPRMLPAFHREHPGIEVRICEETTDQVERSLLSGRLDFAILHTGPDDGLTGNPSLDFEALGRDPFLIAAPHDERLAALAVQRPNAPHPELDPALLGGEPFEPENQRELLPFVRNFKALYPNKTVWCYSGYTWEQLTGKEPSLARCEATDELLSLLDVLVDGEFIPAQHDISLRFRGSSNQRIIDLNATRTAGHTVLWQDDPLFADHKM